MRAAIIFVAGKRAGILREEDSGYTFQYDEEYRMKADALPVSLTLPLQETAFHSNVLFPFFDGLIPEGWLLNIAQRNWKIRRNDRMALLMTCCKDCIGNVSVEPIEEVEK